jgi:tetratricopeptide (TPR) repeat protein
MSPERELLRGLSAQQSGQSSEAEQIYRSLPQFAESWNNLGVLLKEHGKDAEAMQAFRQALERDPQLSEATLNLGRGATDDWTTQYQRYYPGRPMIAVPRTDHNERAFLGGSVPRAALRVVSRPFEIIQLIHRLGGDSGPSIAPLMGMLAFGLFGLLFAILLVTVAPKRDVTVPPGKGEWIWSAVVPGLGPQWGVLSCLVLFAWSYLVIQLVLFLILGTPYVITFLSIPNLTRNYGVSSPPLLRQLGVLNPGWFAIYAAPALLFAANALLVLRNRRK